MSADEPPDPPARQGRARKAVAAHGGDLGFEAKLWQAADKLRNNMDAAEYKHVVLGLIFLKYISDAFEDLHARLIAQNAGGADPEDRDEYRAERVFWVPKEARWSTLQARAKDPRIGQLVDDAGVLQERHARRDPRSPARADARSLRGRAGGRGRRRTVRGSVDFTKPMLRDIAWCMAIS